MIAERATIRADIDDVAAQLKPLMERARKLNAQLRDLDSRIFIEANQIRKCDIEMSTGDGVPWYGTIWEFGLNLKIRDNVKRWAEWNGIIYHTSDIIAGRMPETPGLLEHVTE